MMLPRGASPAAERRFEIHLPSAANPLAGQIRGAAPEKKRAKEPAESAGDAGMQISLS